MDYEKRIVRDVKLQAVLVGCNYPNYPEGKGRLNGCINDAKMMKKMLIGRFGFDPKAMMVLTDKPGSKKLRATGQNIKIQLDNMIAKALPGDRLLFFFAGHGTSFKHKGKLVQAIVACDNNSLTCMDFRHYVNRLPKDATLTVVADSCSSGGLIDQEPVQVGLPYHPRPQKSCHPRMLPYDAYLAQLSSQTELNSPDIGVHLVQLFDSEASILFSLRPDQHPKPLKADQGILLSGCEPDQDTAEDWDENGSPCGAFTKVVVGILKGQPAAPITNKQLIIKARGILGIKAENERQHPCLYCSRKNVNGVFLVKTTARAEIGETSQDHA